MPKFINKYGMTKVQLNLINLYSTSLMTASVHWWPLEFLQTPELLNVFEFVEEQLDLTRSITSPTILDDENANSITIKPPLFSENSAKGWFAVLKCNSRSTI